MINDNLLLETKLSRVLTKINKDNNAICVISAFRNETQEKNIQRNTELAKFVRSENFGFVYVDGGWVENAGTEQEKEVTEVSLFIDTSRDIELCDEKDSKFVEKYILEGYVENSLNKL